MNEGRVTIGIREKVTKKPAIKVQGETIAMYKRSESYKYLGKSFTIAGEE